VTPAAVHAATLAVREAWERQAERALVHEMLESLGGGWAVNGIDPTLHALSRGQVRSLLVHADAASPASAAGTRAAWPVRARVPREGEPVPVLDVVDDAIEEALPTGPGRQRGLRARSTRRGAGLAALLRFR